MWFDKEKIKNTVKDICDSDPGNFAPEGVLEGVPAGMRVFEQPLIGYSSAADPLYDGLKSREAIGEWYLAPKEWLPSAVTVISMFFPYTGEIKTSNAVSFDETSAQWLYGRIEGQQFLLSLCAQLTELLQSDGFEAMSPARDPRFDMASFPGMTRALPADAAFTSTWSERHAAYISGLGTFGLSKGLITEKGICGRFASVITSAEAEPSPRKYTGLYDYCTRCGACIKHCPAQAITLEGGKDHKPCAMLLGKTKKLYAPRYGCGKCQVGVPCMSRRP